MISNLLNSIYLRYNSIVYWFLKTNNSYYFLILSFSYLVLFIFNSFVLNFYLINILLNLNLILLLIIGFFHIFLSMVSLINDYVYNLELNGLFTGFTTLICLKIVIIFLV